MDEATLTIGQLASRSGFKASAIRYYEEQGVLPEPARTGGQRRYTEEMVRRLGIVDVAKQAGFSLQEVRLIERAEAMRRWLTVASSCGCESFEACTLFDDPAAGKSTREAPPNGGAALQLTHVEALGAHDPSCRRVD